MLYFQFQLQDCTVKITAVPSAVLHISTERTKFIFRRGWAPNLTVGSSRCSLKLSIIGVNWAVKKFWIRKLSPSMSPQKYRRHYVVCLHTLLPCRLYFVLHSIAVKAIATEKLATANGSRISCRPGHEYKWSRKMFGAKASLLVHGPRKNLPLAQFLHLCKIWFVYVTSCGSMV